MDEERESREEIFLRQAPWSREPGRLELGLSGMASLRSRNLCHAD